MTDTNPDQDIDAPDVPFDAVDFPEPGEPLVTDEPGHPHFEPLTHDNAPLEVQEIGGPPVEEPQPQPEPEAVVEEIRQEQPPVEAVISSDTEIPELTDEDAEPAPDASIYDNSDGLHSEVIDHMQTGNAHIHADPAVAQGGGNEPV